ncbi:YgdI/YgdR family lipoprotein [Coraliomargarita sp. SDUM461004]|uniref:YgdI/YgdR family lipoprotein n=1 Tax=Thalassobacterium sedimentorum TaxID=3041258 RepID=A0ABU1AK68_9BACT|nr:YgdI/YgdR family lipoprotein [Coraliomargarita sp. SDUM461004]MDQ8195212.1 YgdI/YgdR family lipoprotein [Coraliomargarita sp. SDUM461004]
MKNPLLTLSILAAFVLLTGCATHYAIKDPQTGTVYYTQDYDENDGGSVTFQTEESENQVTIQNSEVRKISQEEYRAATQPRFSY